MSKKITFKSSITNRPTGGGGSKSGLISSVGRGRNGLGRAIGSFEDRKKNFCINQLGGVGSGFYQTRGPSDGVRKNCKGSEKPVGLTFNEQFKKKFQDYLALGKAAGKAKYGKEAKDWDTSRVTKMEHLFTDTPFGVAVPGAVTFNEDISGWDVSNVTSMEGMLLFIMNKYLVAPI